MICIGNFSGGLPAAKHDPTNLFIIYIFSPLANMASALESFVNRQVCIITSDGRNFVGTLKGFDQTINVILDDTHERVFSAASGVEQVGYFLAR